jgi:hypothetical protein
MYPMIGHDRAPGGRIVRQRAVKIGHCRPFGCSGARDGTAPVDPVGEPEQQPATQQEAGQLQDVGDDGHDFIPRRQPRGGQGLDAMHPPRGRILTGS